METYKRFVHPEYNWYDKTLKVINEDLLITSDGEIKTADSLKSLIPKEYADGTKSTDDPFGILPDDGSLALEFMNEIYNNIAESEANISRTKAHIMNLKNIGGIK